MPDPRAAVSFEGIGYEAETFAFNNTIVYNSALKGGSAQVGRAVQLVGNKQVKLAAAGAGIMGKLVKVEQDFCVVQTGGHVTLPSGTGATLAVGSKVVGALLGADEGYITAAVAATAAHHVVSRGTIVDSSDPANVWVRLESAT